MTLTAYQAVRSTTDQIKLILYSVVRWVGKCRPVWVRRASADLSIFPAIAG